jgi:hypothetical protein
VLGRSCSTQAGVLDLLPLVLALDGAGVGEQLVEHQPQRVDVDAAIDVSTGHLLGRHVGVLPLHEARLRLVHGGGSAGHAEVDQLHLAGGRQQDVVRGDVAVDEVERLAVAPDGLVRVVQRPGCVGHQLGAQLRRDELAQPLVLEADGHQIEARHVLHRQVVGAVELPQIVDLGDARVAQLGDQRGLVEEHPQELGVGDEVSVGPLDDADAPGAAGQKDVCHAPGPDAPGQQIWAQHLRHFAPSLAW